LPRCSQTISSRADELIVRLRLPPFKTGEKVHHLLVSLQHHHRVVATPINPTATQIRPDIDPASCRLTGRSVGTGHGDVPGNASQGFRRVPIRLWRPMRIMVFIAIFLVRLWDDTAGAELDLPLLEHKRVLLP